MNRNRWSALSIAMKICWGVAAMSFIFLITSAAAQNGKAASGWAIMFAIFGGIVALRTIKLRFTGPHSIYAADKEQAERISGPANKGQ